MCFLGDTIRQCHDDHFRPHTLFISGVVPKSPPQAVNVIPNLLIIAKPQQLRSICTKLDKVMLRPESEWQLATTRFRFHGRQLSGPQVETSVETYSLPDTSDIDWFSTSEFLLHKALMSFPNGGSSLEGISAQVLKDLTAKLD